MSLPQGQNIKIFQKDPSDNTLVELIMPGGVDNLVHETRLPGGFWTLKFQKPMGDDEYWNWRINRQWFRLQLELGSKDILWEGRLQRYEGPVNAPTLVFGGYYNNFRDSVNNNKTYTKTYNTTADAILKDMLDNAFHANTLQINNTDQSNIAAPGVTIEQAYDKNLNLWDVLTNPTNGVLQTADSSNNIVDFAVLEDRLVHLTIRNPTAVTWKAYRAAEPGGVRGNFAPRVNLMNIRTAITTLYSVSGTENETAVSAATLDTVKELRREFTFANIGESSSGPAVSRADSELAASEDAQQEVDTIVITKVFDANGVQQPLCKVRAGDVLQMTDLVPTSAGLGGAELDAFRTFFITQTKCDHERGEIVIRPDRESKSLAARLARAGIA